MSWIPPDDDRQGDGGAPPEDEDLGTAPTMLYMKPVSEDEEAKAAIDKAAEDLGGETLMMMPAVSGTSAADALSEDGTPQQGPGDPAQGPVAGPLPDGEGLEELDSAKTMMYMPAVGGAPGPDAAGGASGPDGFSDAVQKKLEELRGAIDDGGEDAGSSTMAYMPAVGELPVDQAVDKMLAETGEAPLQAPAAPRIPTAPAFPAVPPAAAPPPAEDLGEAPTAVPEPASPAPVPPPAAAPKPVFKPGPDLNVDDDDDDLSALTGKRKGGKIFLLLFILILLGAGGVFVAMLFDWIARPEFLNSLPHYELNL
jgi:hypothetical protein